MVQHATTLGADRKCRPRRVRDELLSVAGRLARDSETQLKQSPENPGRFRTSPPRTSGRLSDTSFPAPRWPGSGRRSRCSEIVGGFSRMRKLLLLFGLTLLISCVGVKVQGRDTSSKAIAEGTQTTSESSENEDTVADTWGQIIEAPPETFFAADLSDDVRSGLTNTLLVATSEWGNYGPLEYWVLGTDLKAAQELTELFCERRSQLGQWEKSECLSRHRDEHDFESYRKIGADAIERRKASGSMGWNGNREWGIHFYTSSYPLGFDRLFGSSPGGEQKGVFHEYFHAVQQAHIFSRDNDERKALSGLVWFIEGGADYMAQTATRKLWASGKLTTIDNSSWVYADSCGLKTAFLGNG